jgi:signal transduction histidine kinase/DNA-binding response OmpR family regulator
MQRENHSKYLLFTGFSLVLGLLLALTVSALVRMQALAEHMSQIVTVHNAKTEYARIMYDASRERALNLSVMLLADDPFVRDEAYLNFITRAADFIAARSEYRKLAMEVAERLTLERASERALSGYAAQARTVELLMAERRDEARRYLVEQALPAQTEVLQALDELILLQKQSSRTAIAKARQVYLRGYWQILALGVAAMLLGLSIAWFVISRISGVENMLHQAKDAAEEAARIKSDFLANMSHEIRTPLNAVLGMSELLQSTGLNSQQQDYVDTIQTSGSALLTVINDILDFSKIEAGMLELEREAFDICRCIEEALDLQAGKADEKGLELVYQINPHIHPACLGDPARLRQILINLISNAVKFTTQGEIVVRVGELPPQPGNPVRRLHFSVTDSGIGIPPARARKLFTPFTQADAATARKFGGTGLGLVICKRLCELMDGQIWVESSEGQGSTFHFTVTLPPTETQEQRCCLSQPVLVGKRALLVDDNGVSREILINQLGLWGMEADAFASATSALASLWRAAENYDVALIDMDMPGMDGLALAAKIRAYKDREQLPIILLSRFSAPPEASPLFQTYVSKPLKFCQLLTRLLPLCGGQAALAPSLPAIETSDASLGLRAPLRILLAEDNAVNQKVALLMLKKLGYEADVAATGVEVLDSAAKSSYDLIFMDVQMPEMGGLEAARRIRANPAHFNHPMIVAMTASVMQEDIQKCLAVGMDAHIGKPVQLRDLAEILTRCWQARNPQQAMRATPVLDMAVFNGLRALLGGDALAMKDLIDTYINDVPRFLRSLEQAIASGDAQQLGEAIKPLKSSSASLGAHTLAALCGELEEAARRGQGIGLKFKAVETELAQVTAILPDLLLHHNGDVAPEATATSNPST